MFVKGHCLDQRWGSLFEDEALTLKTDLIKNQQCKHVQEMEAHKNIWFLITLLPFKYKLISCSCYFCWSHKHIFPYEVNKRERSWGLVTIILRWFCNRTENQIKPLNKSTLRIHWHLSISTFLIQNDWKWGNIVWWGVTSLADFLSSAEFVML